MFKDIIIVVLIVTIIIITYAYSCLARSMDDYQYIRLQYIVDKNQEIETKLKEIREREKSFIKTLIN